MIVSHLTLVVVNFPLSDNELNPMEGFGDEVILFGVGSVITGCLLLKVLLAGARDGGTSGSDQAGVAEISGGTRTAEVDCCICLGNCQFAVETNCGHVVSNGVCLLGYN